LKSGGVQNGDGTVNEYYEHLWIENTKLLYMHG
jgi:hypothetical protein